jgi:hypothetical protein
VNEGSYSLYIDIPGITQQATYTVEITQEIPELLNLDFVIDITDGFTIDTLNNPETGIEHATNQFEMVAFPNPARNYIILTSDVIKAKAVEISILSKSGAVIRSQKMWAHETAQGEVKVDLSAVISGAYIIKIECDNKVSFKNIIVLK